MLSVVFLYVLYSVLYISCCISRVTSNIFHVISKIFRVISNIIIYIYTCNISYSTITTKCNVEYDSDYTVKVSNIYVCTIPRLPLCVEFMGPHLVKKQPALVFIPNPSWVVRPRKVIRSPTNKASVESHSKATDEVVLRVERILHSCCRIPLCRYIRCTLILSQYAFRQRGFPVVSEDVASSCALIPLSTAIARPLELVDVAIP